MPFLLIMRVSSRLREREIGSLVVGASKKQGLLGNKKALRISLRSAQRVSWQQQDVHGLSRCCCCPLVVVDDVSRQDAQNSIMENSAAIRPISFKHAQQHLQQYVHPLNITSSPSHTLCHHTPILLMHHCPMHRLTFLVGEGVNPSSRNWRESLRLASTAPAAAAVVGSAAAAVPRPTPLSWQ